MDLQHYFCAEYDSPDIERYLREVNDVPDSCIKDPISVTEVLTEVQGCYNCYVPWPLLLESIINSS